MRRECIKCIVKVRNCPYALTRNKGFLTAYHPRFLKGCDNAVYRCRCHRRILLHHLYRKGMP